MLSLRSSKQVIKFLKCLLITTPILLDEWDKLMKPMEFEEKKGIDEYKPDAGKTKNNNYAIVLPITIVTTRHKCVYT